MVVLGLAHAAQGHDAVGAYTGALHDVMWTMAGFCAAATVLVAAVGSLRQRGAAADAAAGSAQVREPVLS